MASVKGLTTCTMEFHHIAKKAEQEAQGDYELENAVEKIGEIVVNGTYTLRTYYKARNEIDDIFGFWSEEFE